MLKESTDFVRSGEGIEELQKRMDRIEHDFLLGFRNVLKIS